MESQTPQGLDSLRALGLACDADLLTTEITRIETAKHLADADFQGIRKICNKKFQERLTRLTGVRIPEHNEVALYRRAYERELERVRTNTSGQPWQCLDITRTELLEIFSQYGHKQGLFSDETKKNQFADAIVFEQLKRTATAHTPVYILSKDKDFETAAQETPHIDLARSWTELLQYLGVERDIEKVDGIFEAHKKVIIDHLSNSLKQHSIGRQRGIEYDLSPFVSSVKFVSGNSVSRKGDVFVAGSAHITYRVPYELTLSAVLPAERVRSREEPSDIDHAEIQEFSFEVFLLAHMRNSQEMGIGDEPHDTVTEGDLIMELEAFGHLNLGISKLRRRTY